MVLDGLSAENSHLEISVAGQLITQLQIVCAEGKEILLVPEISAIAIVDESSARGSPE